MPRQQTIVGIGETVLVEGGEQSQVEGIAAVAAVQALRFAQRAIAITRIGQDPAGDEIVRVLRETGVDINHLQYDPDRPTARRRRMGLAGRTSVDASTSSAFNHLQWDFDLADVAQITDAAVFGLVSQRDGQSRSVIARYLDCCTHAIRLCDLTNRDEAPLDRRIVDAALNHSDAVVVDETALQRTVPSSTQRPYRDAITQLLKQHRLAFAISIEPAATSDNGQGSGELPSADDDASQATQHTQNRRVVLHSADDAWSAHSDYDANTHMTAVMAVLHGMLIAWEPARTMQLVDDVTAFTAEHGNDAIPDRMLSASGE